MHGKLELTHDMQFIRQILTKKKFKTRASRQVWAMMRCTSRLQKASFLPNFLEMKWGITFSSQEMNLSISRVSTIYQILTFSHVHENLRIWVHKHSTRWAKKWQREQWIGWQSTYENCNYSVDLRSDNRGWFFAVFWHSHCFEEFLVVSQNPFPFFSFWVL